MTCDCGEGGGVPGGVPGAQVGWKSSVFAGGKTCEGKQMTGQKGVVAMLNALGMTPA